METCDISLEKEKTVELIKTEPQNEDDIDIYGQSGIKIEDSNLAGDFKDTKNYEAHSFQTSDVEMKSPWDGFLPIKEEIKDESDTSNSVNEIVKTEIKLYDSPLGIMDSNIDHFTPVDKPEVDTNTEEDIPITIKSELENYKSCSVKLERLSDGFLSILERMKFETYTKEDMGATIKSELGNNKSCFVKLERLSDGFLTFEKIIKDEFNDSDDSSKNEVQLYDTSQGRMETIPFGVNTENMSKKLQRNLKLSSLPGQCGTSQTKYKGVTSHSVQNKNRATRVEDKFSKHIEEGDKRLRHEANNAKRINEIGCLKYGLKRVKYIKHGGMYYKNTCTEERCSKYALKGGKCSNHSADRARKRCGIDGCSKYSLTGGKCMKHGGTRIKNTCKARGCSKYAKIGGRCVKHGGRQECKEEGCSNYSLTGGRCYKHGGTYTRRRCMVEGCSNNGLKGGKCIKHGGTRYKFICKEKGCFKCARGGGRCMKHEGILYRKKCKEGNALKGSKYIKNARTYYLCKEEGCSKYAQIGGRCILHGGTHYKYLCEEEGCSKHVRRGGRCTTHGRNILDN